MTGKTKINLVDLQLPRAYRHETHRIAREPIGLLELGSFLKENGAKVEYFIVNSENFDTRRLIENDPEVIGFSTYSYNYPYSLELARRIKSANPKIGLVFGGPHAGRVPESVMKDGKGVIDAVIAGEGELGMIEYLTGRRGVISKKEIDLSRLPKADRIGHLLENPNFEMLGSECRMTAVIVASRGCNHACDYCINRLTKRREKPLEKVFEEIDYLISENHVDMLIFEDPLFNGNLRYLEDLCYGLTEIRRRNAFQATCMLDFDLGKNPSNVLSKMAKAGFVQINWGIGDPRQRYRDRINKRVGLDVNVLSAARDYGISSRGLLMLPTNLDTADPRQDVKEYAESLACLPLDGIKINITTPFPGTLFYDMLLSKGKITDTDLRDYDTNHLVFQAGNWTQESVDWGRKYITQEFNSKRLCDGPIT